MTENICLINAYMPTHNQSVSSQDEYSECLDIIHNIMQNYQDTHKIIICGDMNGTLLRAREYNKHDRLLQDFVREHKLQVASNSSKSTFVHHNGKSQSQIDYIMCQDSQFICDYQIDDIASLNLSAHVPVHAKVNTFLPSQIRNNNTKQSKISTRKLKWENADPEKFCDILKTNLASYHPVNSGDSSTDIQRVVKGLQHAASGAVPSKLIVPKGPKWKITPNVKIIQSECKLAFANWVRAGKPNCGNFYEHKQSTKKQLRQQIRQDKCQDRKDFYNQIMSNPSSKLFYRLIGRNKSVKAGTVCISYKGNSHFTQKDQRRCFAAYYEDLAIPNDSGYDNDFHDLCNIRHDIINELYSDDPPSMDPITGSEVETAIGRLNTGKSPDEFNISSEHIKMGKSVLVPYLCDIYNEILRNRVIPESFKCGTLTPILKKGKDATTTDSYRGITVTAILGKVFEYVLLDRLKISQSSMQFGFTRGLSPTMASLLVSEAYTDNNNTSGNIYLATLDAQKAFDVVDHTILLDKLYHHKVHPDLWLLVKNLYEGLTSRVKWMGELSDSFRIQQGVRQGGILSTELYKAYVNCLLQELEQNRVGLHIGTVYAGCPTCADDVAMLSDNPEELQLMLNIAQRYSKQHRYMLHPSKSKVITNVKSSNEKWSIGENSFSTSDQTVHLGLIRAAAGESGLNVGDRICLARRTMYSLINTGLHGTNGLNPMVSYRIYQAYVLPRLLYGLEVLNISSSHMDSLKRFHHNSLRMFQSLPQRTAICALHLLLGALPISGELHRRQLSFLYLVLSSDNISIQELVHRQSAVNIDNRKSFFSRVSETLLLYQLPSLDELCECLPSKYQWKKMVTKQINQHWTSTFKMEAAEKSTLCMMNLSTLVIGKTHHIWESLESTVTDVRKGITRVRMITGTYMLQTNKCRFSHYQIDPVCPICRIESEDIIHVLTRCPVYHEIRKTHIPKINKELIKLLGIDIWRSNYRSRGALTKIILDSSYLHNVKTNLDLRQINRLSTELCDKIHLQRISMLRI